MSFSMDRDARIREIEVMREATRRAVDVKRIKERNLVLAGMMPSEDDDSGYEISTLDYVTQFPEVQDTTENPVAVVPPKPPLAKKQTIDIMPPLQAAQQEMTKRIQMDSVHKTEAVKEVASHRGSKSTRHKARQNIKGSQPCKHAYDEATGKFNRKNCKRRGCTFGHSKGQIKAALLMRKCAYDGRRGLCDKRDCEFMHSVRRPDGSYRRETIPEWEARVGRPFAELPYERRVREGQ